MIDERNRPMKNYKVLIKDFIIINVSSIGAALIMLGIMLLQRYEILPPFPCAIHEMFHVYCPGCGGTRALFALLHGHILQSLFYNPAVLLGLVLIFYYEIGAIVTLVKKNGTCYYQKGWLLYGYLIVIIIFTIVRNYLLIGFRFDMLRDFF